MSSDEAHGRDDRASARREERRARITEGATRLFMERGYEATSVNTVADQLGLSIGGLYRYIDTKPDLLVMVCENIYGNLPARLSALADGDDDDPLSRLAKVAREYLESCRINRQLILLMYREYRHLPRAARQRYMRREGSIVDLFAELISEAWPSAPESTSTARLAALDLVFLGHLPALKSWAVEPLDEEDDDLIDQQMAIITRAIGVDLSQARTVAKSMPPSW